jgi:hypothetical protein
MQEDLSLWMVRRSRTHTMMPCNIRANLNFLAVSGPTALAESVRVALRSEGGLGVLKGRAPVTLHVETFGM